MRTTAIVHGKSVSRADLEGFKSAAANAQSMVVFYSRRAAEIEAALNEPEPIRDGDIVEVLGCVYMRRLLVLTGKRINHALNVEYPTRSATGPGERDVRLTDGDRTYTFGPDRLRVVGNINRL